MRTGEKMPEYEVKCWTVVIGLMDREGKQRQGEALEIMSDTAAASKYWKVSDALNDRNVLVFNLGDVKLQLEEAMEVYVTKEGIEITEDMLRTIWMEVLTESAVSNINDLIYDACIDYVRENLVAD